MLVKSLIGLPLLGAALVAAKPASAPPNPTFSSTPSQTCPTPSAGSPRNASSCWPASFGSAAVWPSVYWGGLAGVCVVAGDGGAAGAGAIAGNTLKSVHLITNRTGTLTSFKCSVSSDRE